MPDTTTTENKVQFGLKNVHYAVITNTAGAITFGTPKAVPGAVSLELSQEAAEVNFYADNVPYYRTSADQGYTGSLEMARITDQMLQDVWGYSLDTTAKVISEDVDTEPNEIALLFQIDGDQNDDYFVMYRCYLSRPNITGTTINENGKEPQTATLDITCLPLVDTSSGSTINGKVFARTTKDTPTATKAGWFNAVFDDFA